MTLTLRSSTAKSPKPALPIGSGGSRDAAASIRRDRSRSRYQCGRVLHHQRVGGRRDNRFLPRPNREPRGSPFRSRTWAELRVGAVIQSRSLDDLRAAVAGFTIIPIPTSCSTPYVHLRSTAHERNRVGRGPLLGAADGWIRRHGLPAQCSAGHARSQTLPYRGYPRDHRAAQRPLTPIPQPPPPPPQSHSPATAPSTNTPFTATDGVRRTPNSHAAR